MILERFDATNTECLEARNQDYFNNYVNWILPHVKGRSLDVGCGYGYFTKMMAQKATSVIGVDRHYDLEKMQFDPKIQYLTQSTEQFIEGSNEMFDTVVSTEHIEHLEEPVQIKLLEWIVKHLSPEGVFLGSMPNVGQPSGNIYHLKEYSLEQWEKILKRYFKNVVIEPLPMSCQVWKVSQ